MDLILLRNQVLPRTVLIYVINLPPPSLHCRMCGVFMAKEESNTPPRDDIIKFFTKTAVIAVVVYFGFYSFDQWMRKKDGPWEVTFDKDANGTPILTINWAARDYSNCILFHEFGAGRV